MVTQKKDHQMYLISLTSNSLTGRLLEDDINAEMLIELENLFGTTREIEGPPWYSPQNNVNEKFYIAYPNRDKNLIKKELKKLKERFYRDYIKSIKVYEVKEIN